MDTQITSEEISQYQQDLQTLVQDLREFIKLVKESK